jgi:SulP family sulfate permease
VGLFLALLLLIVLLFGAPLIALFPRLVAGSLVCFLGLTFLAEWVIQGWSNLSHWDYLVVIIIMTTMGFISPLAGVGIGLLLATLLFIIQYSRVNVVRHVLDGSSYFSIVERSPIDRSILRQHSDWIYILELQGYIFFGSTQNLLDSIHKRLHDPACTPPHFLLLDFRQVTGMDGSAIMSFVKLRTIAREHPICISFSEMEPRYQNQLERDLRMYGEDTACRYFRDLDHAVEWCEDQFIHDTRWQQSLSDTDSDATTSGLKEFFQAGIDVQGEHMDQSLPIEPLLTYLERRELPEGSIIIHQGDPPVGLYIIEAGQVTAQLTRKDQSPLRLRVMGPGTVVGELSLYLDIPATATVIATQATVVHFLSQEKMKSMERDDPNLANEFHKVILRLVGDRLRTSNRTIQALAG